MAIKRFIRAAAGLTAVVSAIFLWREMVGLGEVRRYNEALKNKDFEQAANIDNEYGMFASAYHLQQQGSHQESRVLYTAIQKSNDRKLADAALFNLGNTYMQHAKQVDIKKDADVAFPLIELAKVTYRELLANDSSHWGAKYNLERALQLSPDSRALPNVEIPGRQNPNRTVISIDPEDSLP